MRHFFLLIIICFSIEGYSQSISLKPPRNSEYRELVLGFRNYFKFEIDDLTLHELHVETTNGRVEIDSSFFIVIPEEADLLKLSFYKINEQGKELFDSKSYLVKKLQNPEPRLYHRRGGCLSKHALKMATIQSENIEYGYAGCYVPLPIREFKIVASRQEELIGYVHVKGNKMNDEAKSLIDSLNSGDKVLFFGITGLNYYREYVELETMSYEVN
jgi:hypothetical protein